MTRQTNSLTLYHWEPNTFALEALAALHEKQLPFESRYVDAMAFEQIDLPFLDRTECAQNLEIEGPVLQTSDAVLTDAFFINLFLDEACPEPALRPTDAAGRWRINAWGRFLGEVMAPAVATLGCHAHFPLRERGGDKSGFARFTSALTPERREAWLAALDDSYGEDLLADSRRKVGLALKRAEDALADGPYLLGAQLSLADLTLFGQANCLSALAPDLLEPAPRVSEWVRRMRERPAVAASLALSRTGAPETAFVPGPEHSRWG
jgi:glutathione S-transferase